MVVRALFAADGTVVFNGGVATTSPATLTEASLRSAAGERSFERGLRYVHAIEWLRVLGDRVVATVRGTEEYQVLLLLGGASPRGECSCPYGREGFFCKHCVAVGLAVIGGAGRVTARRSRGRSLRRLPESAGTPSASGLTSWLDSLSRDDLYVLVVEEAAADAEYRARLELRAAAAAGDAATVADRASYLLVEPEAGSPHADGEPPPLPYARLVRETAMAVGALAGSGHAADAQAIAERAIRKVAAALPAFRDEQGVIAASAADLVASHLAACAAAPADPLVLAGFLAERALAGDLPAPDLGEYAGVLGRTGLGRLRERLMAAWQAANHAGRAEQDALEHLLRVTGDTDALVEVISSGAERGDSRPLRIATELDRAGRHAEALSCAERGLRASGRPDPRLADFVAARYAALGRTADALAVRRDQFAAIPDLAGYRLLRETAGQAGDWPGTREWALRLLREAAAGRGSAGGAGGQRQPPGPVLIDALIDDGDLDAAWAAAPGLATDAQWLRLADLVAATRPHDALTVYRRQIEPLRHQSGERSYLRLARLLDSARDCHRLLGTERDFDAYLTAVREGGKRNRRLLAILDKHQLS